MSGGVRGASMTTTGRDEEAVVPEVSDYVEGSFDGDAERMRRALHPELVKCCRGIEGDDPGPTAAAR